MDYIIANGTIIIGVLVALTNIIVEVLKNVVPLKDAGVINRVATLTGVVLTLIAGVAYFQINAITLTWYYIVAMVLVGVMVAFASMFGYDKLLSYFKELK